MFPITKDSHVFTNPIIGIAGFKGSGKSLLAERIALRLDRRVEIVPFALPFKAIARQMGWNGKKDRRGRRLLQLLGSECGRECIGPDIWVNRWRTEVVKHLHEGTITIADDMRFLNEAAAILVIGGLLIKIERPGHGYRLRWWNPVSWLRALRAHGSERDLPYNYDYIFENDGSIEGVDYFAQLIADLVNERFSSCCSSE